MSTLKIPDLNLFRGKRQNKQGQYQGIRQESLGLLQKTTNKQLLADIKAQLYLQNYQNTLTHFVSPTKYKQKAQNYLSTESKHTDLFLKAITLPKTLFRCPTCFSKEIQARQRCHCQLQHPRLSLARSKSNQYRFMSEKIDDHRRVNPIQQTKIVNQQAGSSRQRPKWHSQDYSQSHLQNHFQNQVQNHSQQHFQNTKGPSKPPQNNIDKPQFTEQQYQQQQQINQQLQAAKRLQSINETKARKQRQLQLQKLREELHAKQNKLENLDLNLNDSITWPTINLEGIIEAKNSYISKHKQILSSLEQIVERGQTFTKH